jgi:hypothetical protein
MKAVGVLFGFLGFSNYVFFINPQDGGFWEASYLLTNAVLQSSQVSITRSLLRYAPRFHGKI